LQGKSKTKIQLKELCDKCGKSRGEEETFTSWLFKPERCLCKPVEEEDNEQEEDYAERRRALKKLGSELDLGERFRIIEKIGGGGMGTVYKVEDLTIKETLAVKVLNPVFARDSSKKRRFIREIKALENLDHGNIVSVYGHSEATNGLPFMVMEHIQGMTLAQMLKDKTVIDEHEALPIFQAICDALEYSHSQGIVHRDLKPSNIMLTPGEGANELQVKVVDFGISKLRQEGLNRTTNLTQTGEIFGSPYYMSPEQCHGEEIDKRSDIYSLGCLMYEVLTGKPPFFGGNPVGVIMSHLKDRPRPFKRANPEVEVKPLIEAVILQCLEKTPQLRFQSMNEVASALKSAARAERSEFLHRQSVFGKVNYTPAIAGLCVLLIMELSWAAGMHRLLPAISMLPKLIGMEEKQTIRGAGDQTLRYISDRANTKEEAVSEAVSKKAYLNGCEFRDFDFTGKKFNGVNFQDSVFENCVFKDIEFSNMDFARARFKNCVFTGALIVDSNVNGTHFEACDFTHARFRRTPLKHSIRERCVFHGTVLDDYDGY